MDSSMTDNNQRYILHVTPVAGVDSQYTLTIESVPIIHDEATYHESQNDNQPAYLPISTTSLNQLQMFESHQALSYTSDPAVCIATASYCPATSFALPRSPLESTNPSSDTEASCSTQCTPSTSTQIFHHPISQPESDHVEDKMNKQSHKSTFDGCENEKNLVVPNGERQHAFHFHGCDKLLSIKTRLEDNLKLSHTGERSYTCDFVNDYNTICGKTFHKKQMLKRHVKLHGEKKHICSICSKGFTRRVYLKTHIKTHTGEKKHICSICTKGFRRKDHLNSHIRIHRILHTEATCRIQCTPSTSTQIFHHPISQPESDHVEDKMNKQSRKSTFDGCKNEKNVVVPNGEHQHTFHFEGSGKLLPTNTRLDDHLKSSHTGERSYTCDFFNDSNTICGKKFHKERALKQHVATHVEKIHICSICSKAFAMSEYLKQHIKTHGEKMHICFICSKGFTTSHYLQKHIGTHTKEKMPICYICFEQFKTNASLQRHIRIHTGEKMYTCFICTKGFPKSDHLNRHIETHQNARRKKLSVQTINNQQAQISDFHMAQYSQEQLPDSMMDMPRYYPEMHSHYQMF